jgi:hypothetical protein
VGVAQQRAVVDAFFAAARAGEFGRAVMVSGGRVIALDGITDPGRLQKLLAPRRALDP